MQEVELGPGELSCPHKEGFGGSRTNNSRYSGTLVKKALKKREGVNSLVLEHAGGGGGGSGHRAGLAVHIYKLRGWVRGCGRDERGLRKKFHHFCRIFAGFLVFCGAFKAPTKFVEDYT